MFRLEHETRQRRVAGRAVFRRRQNKLFEQKRELRVICFTRLEMAEGCIKRAKAHAARIVNRLIKNIAGQYSGIVGDPRLVEKWPCCLERLPAGGLQGLRFILEPDAHGSAIDPGIGVEVDEGNLGIGKARAILNAILLEGEVAAVGREAEDGALGCIAGAGKRRMGDECNCKNEPDKHQNARKVMIVWVSLMPGIEWTFSLTKWPMSVSGST